MDFDDLLTRAYELLSKHPEVLDRYQERFRQISVDEYQDTNKAQYAITNLLAAKYRNLMVVGDDDQSIYSWRGADIQNILDFEKDYPEAKVVRLEENYRSTGHILAAANAVVAHNSRRKEKHLFTSAGDGERIRVFQAADERDEGRWIGSEIEKLHDAGTSYDDIAVFYRTNAQSRILEDMFLRAGVPYKIVGGTRFFDRAEIRDVMAYLKLVVNPDDDVSAMRVVNTPRRGIGTTSVRKISAYAAENGLSFFAAAQLCVAESGLLSAKVRGALGEFCATIEAGRHMTGELRDVVEAIVDRTGLIQALRAENSIEADGRIENIQEFYGVAAEFDETHDDVEETLESLIEARYVDDRRFAYNYVQLHREDRSRLRIRTDLENRGVPDDVISEVMREESEEHGTQAEVRQILKLMRKRGFDPSSADWEERRKMQAYLYRKGYAASSVRSAMSADLLDSDGFSV